MNFQIRRATPDEAATLTEIAHAAKRHWGYPETWIELWNTDLTITRDFVARHEVFVAVGNDQVIGCCALVMSHRLAEIEHMWIRPEQIGSGVGRGLFEHAKGRAQELGAEVLELSADPHAEGFYEHMGAARIGEVSAEMDGTPRVLPRMRIEFGKPPSDADAV